VADTNVEMKGAPHGDLPSGTSYRPLSHRDRVQEIVARVAPSKDVGAHHPGGRRRQRDEVGPDRKLQSSCALHRELQKS